MGLVSAQKKCKIVPFFPIGKTSGPYHMEHGYACMRSTTSIQVCEHGYKYNVSHLVVGLTNLNFVTFPHTQSLYKMDGTQIHSFI